MSEGTSPPPAALERAREWLLKNCVCECPENDLATLLTEERTKALSEREAEIERLREALEDAATTFEWLAENEPDCLGWIGHAEPDGPWPEVKERASAARAALNPARGEKGTEDDRG